LTSAPRGFVVVGKRVLVRISQIAAVVPIEGEEGTCVCLRGRRGYVVSEWPWQKVVDAIGRFTRFPCGAMSVGDTCELELGHVGEHQSADRVWR
jgi:hypothetical protein